MIRRLVRNCRLRTLAHKAHPLAPEQWRESAILFSPHFDDETLGAGGTIIKKCQRGAEVHLVFMTDGSRSHAHAMDGARLAALRREGAIRAAAVLGVDESRVHFLSFPETRLTDHVVEAASRVADILAATPCDQVFIPSSLEPLLWSADHQVTTDVVLQALRQIGARPHIMEYLVWHWYHWPWVPVVGSHDTRQLLRLTWKFRFGRSATRSINTAVPIADVLDQKLRALNEHRSQMSRLVTDKPWPVLADVAQGAFLHCFFESAEFFTSHSSPSALGADR